MHDGYGLYLEPAQITIPLPHQGACPRRATDVAAATKQTEPRVRAVLAARANNGCALYLQLAKKWKELEQNEHLRKMRR